jgi:hypothetical protein
MQGHKAPTKYKKKREREERGWCPPRVCKKGERERVQR